MALTGKPLSFIKSV
ncbi:hypothetical protein YPPY96_3956, partial [Yersinia pestis PY-96]